MKYLHYTTKKFLTPNQCDRVVQYLETSDDAKRDKEGQVYVDLSFDNGLYDRLYTKCENIVQAFNFSAHGWHFDIDSWQQPLRVSRYDHSAGMDWHMDYTADDKSKIAFSVALSDERDYKGGELRLLETEPLEPLRRGYGVVFPAFAGHKVEPVTGGTRYVLLGWMTGPRFV